MAALSAVVDRAAGGAGRLVVVEGEAGVGKSRLVDQVLARAKIRGYQVLLGPAEELCHGACSLFEGGRLPFLEQLAAEAPLVLALEDLQQVERDRVAAVLATGNCLGDLPLVLLATLDPSRRPDLEDLRGALSGTPSALHLVLDPLDDEAVALLAKDLLGVLPGPALLACLRQEGGNPRRVLELVTRLRDEGRIDHRDGWGELRSAPSPDGPSPDPGEAAQRSASDPLVALRILQRALERASPWGPGQDALVAELAPWAVRTGHLQVEPLIRHVLARRPEPVMEVRLRRLLGELLWSRARPRTALTELEATQLVSEEARSAHLASLAVATNVRIFLGEVEDGLSQAGWVLAEAAEASDEEAMALALQAACIAAMAKGEPEEAVNLGRQAVEMADRRPAPLPAHLCPHLWLGLALSEVDRPADAEPVLGTGRRRAWEEGSVTSLPFHHWALASSWLLGGWWDDALVQVDVGLDAAEKVQASWDCPPLHALPLWVAVHRGDLVAARDRLAAAQRQLVPGSLLWSLWVRGVEALLAEAEGDQRAALHMMVEGWELSAPLRLLSGYRLFGPDLVRLALAVGDRCRAESVTAEVEQAVRRSAAPGAAGAALRCRGLLEDDPERLLQAVDALRSVPRPVERAFACEEAGMALGRAGRAEQARSLLREALAVYRNVGAARDVSRAESTLSALQPTRRRRRSAEGPLTGWDSLTESEMRVVRLACEGLTNRQIGQRLFVSGRTVETHLSHVYRKLNLSTRAQLATEAVRRGLEYG